MTQNTSLPLVNINDDVDKKVSEFFNGYFLPKAKVSENDYELIKSFCVARTSNIEAASALTAALINVINELDLYAADVLEQFDNTNLKESIPLFLNLSRNGVSLLGYVQDKIVPPRVKQQILS
tara:strand:- start:1606 stop:1974 length:369 start_codon:yes stop_codon:yes gene_type:complete